MRTCKYSNFGPNPQKSRDFSVFSQKKTGVFGPFLAILGQNRPKFPNSGTQQYFFDPGPKIGHKMGYRPSFSDLKVFLDSWNHPEQRFLRVFCPKIEFWGSPDPKMTAHGFQTGLFFGTQNSGIPGIYGGAGQIYMFGPEKKFSSSKKIFGILPEFRGPFRSFWLSSRPKRSPVDPILADFRRATP